MNTEIDKRSRTPKSCCSLGSFSKSTHHFLREEDIEYFKPLLLNTYVNAVELRCIRNNSKKIVGFIGVADQKLEMLFIHPENRVKRIGKTLLEYSMIQLNVTQVDVNEQNEQAHGFYKHHRFETIGRAELDFFLKPYPTLPMELKK